VPETVSANEPASRFEDRGSGPPELITLRYGTGHVLAGPHSGYLAWHDAAKDHRVEPGDDVLAVGAISARSNHASRDVMTRVVRANSNDHISRLMAVGFPVMAVLLQCQKIGCHTI
jgi:hypothetical protein